MRGGARGTAGIAARKRWLGREGGGRTLRLTGGVPPSYKGALDNSHVHVRLTRKSPPMLRLPLHRPAEELMQIGDLAREAGKTARAIHLYEELGLLTPAARSKGRYRLYGAESLVRIRWIGRLQEMGFSLSDIQTIVREWERAGSAPNAMKR